MKKLLTYIYKTFFFDPLAGGNGKIQMDEMARAILLGMIVKASIREGETVEQMYPNEYWFCIFVAVCAVAGIKKAFSKNDPHEQPPSQPPVL